LFAFLYLLDDLHHEGLKIIGRPRRDDIVGDRYFLVRLMGTGSFEIRAHAMIRGDLAPLSHARLCQQPRRVADG